MKKKFLKKMIIALCAAAVSVSTTASVGALSENTRNYENQQLQQLLQDQQSQELQQLQQLQQLLQLLQELRQQELQAMRDRINAVKGEISTFFQRMTSAVLRRGSGDISNADSLFLKEYHETSNSLNTVSTKLEELNLDAIDLRNPHSKQIFEELKRNLTNLLTYFINQNNLNSEIGIGHLIKVHDLSECAIKSIDKFNPNNDIEHNSSEDIEYDPNEYSVYALDEDAE